MGNLISGGYKIHWLVIRFLITWQFCRSIFKHSHRCHRFGMICLHICFETRTCLSLDGCVSQDSTLRLDGSCKNVRLETNTFFWTIAIFTKWPTRWLNFWISSKSESSVYTQLARFKPQVKRSSKRIKTPSNSKWLQFHNNSNTSGLPYIFLLPLFSVAFQPDRATAPKETGADGLPATDPAALRRAGARGLSPGHPWGGAVPGTRGAQLSREWASARWGLGMGEWGPWAPGCLRGSHRIQQNKAGGVHESLLSRSFSVMGTTIEPTSLF